MEKKIQLLDCTLRDGAYIVDAKFGTPSIKGIIKKSQDANIDVIECGWLKNTEHVPGTSFFHVPDDLLPYIIEKKESTTYVVMIDWDRYDLDFLPEYDGKTIDAIRVVFPHGKHKEGIAVGKKIREKGYKVFYQAANTLAYTNDDLLDLAKEVNETDAESVSVVDTFGAMYDEDLERIVKILDENLNSSIKLGFHSHNNQQLSFALTMHFVELLAKSGRDIVVDASLCGMGRGAGNATTELVANYLNLKQNCNYDMDAIMDAIDVYMGYFQQNFEWGYSTPYFIAGMYCCHVNNIAYLLKNHRTNAKDMRNIIESLSPEDRKKYDYDLLEEKYIENQNRLVDDQQAIEKISASLKNRKILLVAPGKSSVMQYTKIKEYIDKYNPVVIGVNALLENYSYDYLFITNSARYSYAKEVYSAKFAEVTKIVASNVKTTPEENEYVINFNYIIKRGWEHFDNAVMCCLRFLDKLQMQNVAIAGFDGFKKQYNESYADVSLPTLNENGEWDGLNEEIKDMFQDFKNTANFCKNIQFVTESIFEK